MHPVDLEGAAVHDEHPHVALLRCGEVLLGDHVAVAGDRPQRGDIGQHLGVEAEREDAGMGGRNLTLQRLNLGCGAFDRRRRDALRDVDDVDHRETRRSRGNDRTRQCEREHGEQQRSDHRLRARGISLRLRAMGNQGDEQWVQTVKGGMGGTGKGVFNPDEIEAVVGGPEPDLSAIDDRKLRQAIARAMRSHHIAELRALGVDIAVQPEFEGGVEMLRQVLIRCGRDDSETQRLVAHLREDLYGAV